MSCGEATPGPDDGEIDSDAVGPHESWPAVEGEMPSLRTTGQAREEERTVKDVLRLVDQISPEAFAGMKAYRKVVLATRLVRKARDWGMVDAREMAIFCVLWRYPGKAFFERAAWLNAAERVKRGETAWSKVFEEPQIWEEPPQRTRA